MSKNKPSTVDPQQLIKFFKTTHFRRFELGETYDDQYLTLRELDVISFLIQGCTIEETARKLRTSPRTTQTQVYKIKKKLRVKTLFELGIKIAEIGARYLCEKPIDFSTYPLD